MSKQDDLLLGKVMSGLKQGVSKKRNMNSTTCYAS